MRWLDMPPVWLAGFLALGYWLSKTTVLPVMVVDAGGLALALVAVGAILMGLAAAQFQRRKTTIIPHREASALITSGVFRISRNPIYLADVLILTGAIFWWQGVFALILVPVFMAVLEWRFIRPEEKRLKAMFGDEFEAWAGRVRRWL